MNVLLIGRHHRTNVALVSRRQAMRRSSAGEKRRTAPHPFGGLERGRDMMTDSISQKRVVVRYKVKAGRLEEHEDLIRKVFAELATARPTGLAYHALKLEDGVSFVHVATVSTADGQNPLTTLAAFKAFTANIGDRCEEKAVNSQATTIGAYRADDAPT